MSIQPAQATSDATPTVDSWTRFPLDRPFGPDGGHAVITGIPEAVRAQLDTATRDLAVVTEDERLLLRPTDDHEYIRREGGGAFSVWGDSIFFSSSDQSNPQTNSRSYALYLPSAETAARARRFPLKRPFSGPEGRQYRAQLPESAKRLLDQAPEMGDYMLVIEDGAPLPRPTVHNQHILEFGDGRYCLTGDTIYFSPHGDATAEGHAYEVEIPDPGYVAAVARARDLEIVGSDSALLGLTVENADGNNTCWNNYFGQGWAIVDFLAEHDLRPSGQVVDLGCGNMPWKALRLLAEGADYVIANDLGPVMKTLPSTSVEPFLELLRRIDPHAYQQLAPRRHSADDGRVTIEGLTSAGGIAFEDLDFTPGLADLVVSNSVLEHVKAPEAVYEAMARAVRVGGHMAHWVDLRDHLAFHDPLRFLHRSAEEYALIDTENRLRASDHLRLLAENGFDVLDTRVQALDPQTGTPGPWRPPMDDVPAITAADRAGFDPAFHHYELADLSVVGLQFLAVRR